MVYDSGKSELFVICTDTESPCNRSVYFISDNTNSVVAIVPVGIGAIN
jgi:hypothetical protein